MQQNEQLNYVSKATIGLKKLFLLTGKYCDDETLATWASELYNNQIRLKDIARAIQTALDSNIKPYDLTFGTFVLLLKPERNLDLLAESEFEKVLKHLRWPTRKLEISDAGHSALRSCGGLSGVGETSPDKLNFVRKNFISSFKEVSPHKSTQLQIENKNPEFLNQLLEESNGK